MATMNPQAPGAPQRTTNAARDFWDAQMAKHQGLNFTLTIIASCARSVWGVFGYIFGGHWIVSLAKQGIIIAGRIATSILFFVALWVAGRSTEPGSMAHALSLVSFGWVKAAQADHFAVIAFTLLPDCLLLGCILLTIDQWVLVYKRSGLYWVWAIAYSAFAAIFTFIAVYTFISFINGAAITIQAGQVDGMTIVRALSGWLYALTEMIHAGVEAKYGRGRQPMAQEEVRDLLTATIDTLNQKVLDSLSDFDAQMKAFQKAQSERVARELTTFQMNLVERVVYELKGFQEVQAERLGQIEAWVGESLAPMNERLLGLSSLPDLAALEQRMVTTVQRTVQTTVREVKGELAAMPSVPPRMALPQRTVSGDTPARGVRAVSQAAETKQEEEVIEYDLSIDPKQWVWARMHEDESRSEAERQAEPYSTPGLLRLARAARVKTSQGSVHSYRTEYAARRAAGEQYPFQ